MPDATLVKEIISSKHPEWKAKREAWKRNERRFQAGDDVYDELTPFRWEASTATLGVGGAADEHAAQLEGERRRSGSVADTDGYARRKERAIFPELPAQAAEKFVGILFQEPPETGWGGLGEVRDDPEGAPTPAEMIWENADGTGRDARSWERFWSDAMQNAMATKYRWIMVEAPREAARTLADEARGLRPYLVEYSPTQVEDWLFERGTLQYARIVYEERRVRIKEGRLTAENETAHYLLVRAGFEGFGDDFRGGGWWQFDENGAELASGRWDRTKGDVPLFRLYYERGGRGDSRTGITHLGNIAVAYMEVLSWLYHDSFVSGSRKRYIGPVDAGQWAEMVSQHLDGAIEVPIPAPVDGSTNTVSVFDTGQVTANTALTKMLEVLLQLAQQTIMRELVTAPDASGASRRVEFLQGNAPRLASMAANIEEAQTAALQYLNARWGYGFQGYAKWKRNFDLRTAMERVKEALEIFELASRAPVQSETLTAGLISDAIVDAGLYPADVDADGAQEEIRAHLRLSRTKGQVEVLRSAAGTLSLESALEVAGIGADDADRRRLARTDFVPEEQ